MHIFITMDSRLLVHLAVAIDLGSLNRAAQRLNVTQPTLTRSIKIIEDRVGAPVLIRESSGVVATDIGEKLAEKGRAVLSESESADDAVRLWRDGQLSEIRLGLGPLLAATLLPQLTELYMRRKWPYRLRLHSASAAPLIRRLNDHRLDMALAPAQLRLHQERLVQEVVFKDRLKIFAGTKSPLSKPNAKVTRADLENGNWLIAGARAGIHGTEEEIFQYLGIEPKRIRMAISGDLQIPLHLLKTTDALIALPERLTNAAGDLGGARIIDFDFPEIRRDIALWMRKTDQNRTEYLHFRKVLLEYLEEKQ